MDVPGRPCHAPQEICYRNTLLGAFFQSGKTLPIQVRWAARGCCW